MYRKERKMLNAHVTSRVTPIIGKDNKQGSSILEEIEY
jgi:hypothetical protein